CERRTLAVAGSRFRKADNFSTRSVGRQGLAMKASQPGSWREGPSRARGYALNAMIFSAAVAGEDLSRRVASQPSMIGSERPIRTRAGDALAGVRLSSL